MLLVKLASDVEQTGSGLEDSHRGAILFDVNESGHTAVRVDGRVPFGLGISRAHIDANIVVRNATKTLTA